MRGPTDIRSRLARLAARLPSPHMSNVVDFVAIPDRDGEPSAGPWPRLECTANRARLVWRVPDGWPSAEVVRHLLSSTPLAGVGIIAIPAWGGTEEEYERFAVEAQDALLRECAR